MIIARVIFAGCVEQLWCYWRSYLWGHSTGEVVCVYWTHSPSQGAYTCKEPKAAWYLVLAPLYILYPHTLNCPPQYTLYPPHIILAPLYTLYPPQLDPSTVPPEGDPPRKKRRRRKITWEGLWRQTVHLGVLMWSLYLRISFVLSIVAMMVSLIVLLCSSQALPYMYIDSK